jgi:hypothetical protein
MGKYWVANHPSGTLTSAQATKLTGFATGGPVTALTALSSAKTAMLTSFATTSTGKANAVKLTWSSTSSVSSVMEFAHDGSSAISSATAAWSATVAAAGFLKIQMTRKAGTVVTRYVKLWGGYTGGGT